MWEAWDEDCRSHGALLLVNGMILQAVGVPSPPGLIPVIPKYSLCDSAETPWRLKGSSLCRITKRYGPLGVAEGIRSSGINERLDPVYGAPIPYVERERVQACIPPLRAFAAAVAGGDAEVVRVASMISTSLRGARVRLGLTGSHALGAAHEGSDVDLVVYEGHEEVYEFFRRHQGYGTPHLGGVEVEPPPDTTWRKALISGIPTTWTPAGTTCSLLRSYWSIPSPERLVKLRVRVEPGQRHALEYPPCVAGDKAAIVSFEFNLGGILYEGGVFEVEGLAGGGRHPVVYLGLREYPGSLRILS